MKQVTKQDLINEGYTEGKKSFEFLWAKVDKNFDWKMIYEAMKVNDWHWCIDKEKNLYGIPRIDNIRQSAKELLYDAYEREAGTISCGGFSGGYDDGHLWLSFILEACHTSEL